MGPASGVHQPRAVVEDNEALAAARRHDHLAPVILHGREIGIQGRDYNISKSLLLSVAVSSTSQNGESMAVCPVGTASSQVITYHARTVGS